MYVALSLFEVRMLLVKHRWTINAPKGKFKKKVRPTQDRKLELRLLCKIRILKNYLFCVKETRVISLIISGKHQEHFWASKGYGSKTKSSMKSHILSLTYFCVRITPYTLFI